VTWAGFIGQFWSCSHISLLHSGSYIVENMENRKLVKIVAEKLKSMGDVGWWEECEEPPQTITTISSPIT